MSSLDLLAVIVAALALGASMLVGAMVLSEFREVEGLPQQPLDDSMAALESMDGVFAFLIVGICLTTVLLAFIVRTHPALFVISFMITLLLIPAATIVSNVYYELAHSEQLADYAEMFPLTYYTFEYLPKICVVFSAIVLVVTYGKVQNPYGM